MIRLHTLGSTRLLADDGSEGARVLTQPKPLALLAYLAVADPGAFQRRDTLLALFWPEHDEKHARWALNQTARRLRNELGTSIIASRGADAIGVDPDVVWCDAVVLEQACASGDWSTAVQLYRGEFLDGLHVADCAELAQWMDARRARLRRLAADATWSLAERLEARGALQEAISAARKATQLAPEYEPGVRRLIGLLDACGDRAGAVQVYEDYVKWLGLNLEVQPAPETIAAIEGVKSRGLAASSESSSSMSKPVSESAGASVDVPSIGQSTASSREPHALEATQGRWRVWSRLVAAAVVAGALIGTVWLRGGAGSREGVTRAVPFNGSIAVLPLENLMGDPKQDYFVDGMHEAVISELSKVGGLKVISRTSTMSYRQTDKPLRQVASELDVEGVIVGSVLREGERVRIAVDLIHGPTDRHLWSQTFDGELRAVLALQSEVAWAITSQIRGRLAPRERRVPASTGAVHPEAHLAYLRGRHQLSQITYMALEQARDHFREALDLDPRFSPAYVGLADVYNRFAIQGLQPPLEVYPLAKAALARALELDSSLADAYALQGVVKFRFDWDWEGAERDLKHALELEPGNPRAHLGYGMYLLVTGRLEQALAYSARHQELDPLSPFASRNLSLHLYHNRRHDEAIARLHVALHLDASSAVAYALLGENHAARGEYGAGVTACDRALGLASRDDEVASRCGAVYAASGKQEDAARLMRQLELRSAELRYVDPYRRAYLAAALYAPVSNADSILYWLDRAYEERSGNLCMIGVEPVFDGMRDHPRFRELVERLRSPRSEPLRQPAR